jgi:hypothetical protein
VVVTLVLGEVLLANQVPPVGAVYQRIMSASVPGTAVMVPGALQIVVLDAMGAPGMGLIVSVTGNRAPPLSQSVVVLKLVM